MNRQQRRRAARGKPIPGVAPKVRYYNVPLTPAEMDLVCEGLDALRRTMDEDIDVESRSDLQNWAYKRAGQVRDILQAELEGRPYYDGDPDRLEPAVGTAAENER